jgi:4-amino-4-deoxy-L-arabinose transferase-like glycosyltransferase
MLKKLVSIPPTFLTGDARRLTPLAYLFLVMLCVAFFSPGLVTMPPTDRDESLFAQASKQMIETGNYTDIRVQDTPRYKKPIGIYWLQSMVVRAINPDHLNQIWAYRLPSMLGATLAVLMTAALGCLLFTPEIGLLGAVMLASCVLLNAEARLATTDASLLGCVMVAMYGLARARLEQKASWGVTLAFWTAVAAGILLKGPIILLPLASALLWLRVTEKNIGWFRTLRPVPGILWTILLAAPWFVAIMMQSHGAFMAQSAGHDMMAKIWEGQNRGKIPPGAHLLALPIAFFPFSLFAVMAAPEAWRNRQDAAVRFCIGWIVPTWIIFELSLTKLLHYVLPVYPAIALLSAKFLLDWLGARKAAKIPLILVVGVWLMVGVGYAAFFAFLPDVSDGVFLWPQATVGVALVLAQGIALLLLPYDKIASTVALTIGFLVFITVSFDATLPGLHHLWISREIVQNADDAASCGPTQIVSSAYHEPSLVFMAGTQMLLPSSAAEAATALKDDPCRIAVIGVLQKQDFLDGFKGSDIQPVEMSEISGLNVGHGGHTQLVIYGTAHNPGPADVPAGDVPAMDAPSADAPTSAAPAPAPDTKP